MCDGWRGCYNPTLPASNLQAVLSALAAGTDDSDLVARLKRRDPQAMGILYDQYGSLAYSLILRILKDGSAAEDVLAEVFVQCWNQAAGLKDSRASALGLWILALAHNRALEYVQAKEGRLTGEKSKPSPLACPAVFQDFSKNRSTRQLQDLRSALRNMDSSQRWILELAYFEGLTPVEIAARLDRPLADIKADIQAALDSFIQLDERILK